jgi:hypothetical protein
MTKAEALEKIRVNIATFGHHVYLVMGGPTPRFVYSIGVSEDIGVELIFAGGAFFSGKQAHEIIDRLASVLRETPSRSQSEHSFGELGTFSLREVHPTWSSKLILGALDYYKAPVVPALQIVPDEEHRTIDVPDLSQARSETSEPIWQWLDKAWDYPIPKYTSVITDMAALRGAPITEANRWEDDAWELYSVDSKEIEKETCRAVPFGTLIGADPSLELATELDVGEGIWRDPVDLEWKITRLPPEATSE